MTIFNGMRLKRVFFLAILMIFAAATASHADPCIGFGCPEKYKEPVVGCDSVENGGNCQYFPPFTCPEPATYTWEIIRPSDPSLGKGGSINETGNLSVDAASCGAITVKVTGSCGRSAEKQIRLGTDEGDNPTSRQVESQHFGCGSEACYELGNYKCKMGDTVIGFFWADAKGGGECANCPHQGWPCPDFNVERPQRKTYSLGINRWECKE